MDTSIILDTIRQRRKALGLTQKHVAQKLYMDERTYSKIERGCKKSLDVNFLFDVASILEVELCEILCHPAVHSQNNTIGTKIREEDTTLLESIRNLLVQIADQQKQLSTQLKASLDVLQNDDYFLLKSLREVKESV